MKTYKIFISRTGESEAVKQGWSWPAFLFGPFWALFKQLWLVGIGFILLFVILGMIQEYYRLSSGPEMAMTFQSLTSVIGLGVSFTFGIKGNRWRESILLARGFRLLKSIEAESPDAAKINAIIKKNSSSSESD